MTAKTGEDEALSIVRPRLINWLGDEGRDPAIRSFAAEKARSYLNDPATLDPVLVPPVLELAAQDGDRALFDAYRTHVETATAPNTRTQFLYALGAFRNQELRRAALDYVLSGPIRPHEIFTATRALGEDETSREEAYRWMTQNYDAITGRLPQEFAAFMPFYAAGCSEERLKQARAFFADPKHQAPGQELQLAEVADQVEDCVGLREREGDAMVSYLETSTSGAKAGRSSASPR